MARDGVQTMNDYYDGPRLLRSCGALDGACRRFVGKALARSSSSLMTLDRMGPEGIVAKKATMPYRSGSLRSDKGEVPELARTQPRTMAL